MKFLCECEHIIRDQTDYIPYKAYLISDEDKFNLWDRIDKEVLLELMEDRITLDVAKRDHRSMMSKVDRRMYQCESCLRLFIVTHKGDIVSYLPEDPELSRNLLRGHDTQKS